MVSGSSIFVRLYMCVCLCFGLMGSFWDPKTSILGTLGANFGGLGVNFGGSGRPRLLGVRNEYPFRIGGQ